MKIEKITESWLKKQRYTVTSVYRPPTIEGVILKELRPIVDGRGDVTELWSLPWVKAEGFEVPRHCYQSATDFGVTKCWHLHSVHTDQMTVTRGKLQVVLVDVRRDSKTFGQVNSVFMGSLKPRLLKIPPGVLHGWKALSTPEVIVVNFQTDTYDPKDEFRFSSGCILKKVWEPIDG